MKSTQPPKTFDEALLTLRQKRAASLFMSATSKPADFLLDVAAEDLAMRLQTISRRFDRAVDLFGRSGKIATALGLLPTIGNVVRLEIEGFHTRATDAEIRKSDPATLALQKASSDLIVSAFALHWSNDLPGSLVQINQALRPDGLFLGLLPGPDTLKELRHCLARAESEMLGGISPRIDPFIAVQTAGSLLQRTGFALPVVDTETIIVRYDTATDLMHDLRAMAATNVLTMREKRRFSAGLFKRAGEIYQQEFADTDGRIRASFEFISLSGWAPDESQPRPLKPGSAKTSLADILKQVRDEAKE